MYRLGGRETNPRYAGSFSTMREATTRRNWVAGELAAMRVPQIGLLAAPSAPTLRDAAEAWAKSRVDVSEATSVYHRSALLRAAALLDRRIDEISAADVAGVVGELAGKCRSRETIRKTVTVLAMIFDHASITPNPARDRIRVKLPREDRPEVSPPTGAPTRPGRNREHVHART